jgi:hypothetical protein
MVPSFTVSGGACPARCISKDAVITSGSTASGTNVLEDTQCD